MQRAFSPAFFKTESSNQNEGETMSNLNTALKAIFLAALFTCISVGSAFAQRPGGMGGGPVGGGPVGGGPVGGPVGGGPQGGGEFIVRLAGVLGLTEAQLIQIRTIQQNAATAAQPYAEQLKPLFEQAHALTEASMFNEAALRALHLQMAPLQLEIHLIQARAHSEIYNLLTAEQKAKLAELRQIMQAGGGRPGGGGGPMGGRLGGGRPVGN